MMRSTVLLCFLVGCATAAPKQQPAKAAPAEVAEQPIPSDLRDQIARSSAIGRELYMLDKVAALGTDVLLAKVPDPEAAGIAGYIPVQEGNDSGEPIESFLISFFTADTPPRIAYDVRVARNAAPAFQAFVPPKEASSGFAALVRARQVAIAAMPATNQPINPVLLPAQENGETGVLVYLLAGTKQPNVAVFGRHFRALVPLGGTQVSYMMPLSKTALQLSTRDEHGHPVAALMVTQLVTDYPLETHVFTSLLTKKLVYVATSRGTWRVNGDQIAFLGALETSDAK